MEQDTSGPSPGVSAGDPTLKNAIDLYLGSRDSGIYQSNSEHVLNSFRDWAGGQGYQRVSQLDKQVLTAYTEQLRKASDKSDNSALPYGKKEPIAASTAWNYYYIVSGLLTYCVQRDWLNTNPAHKQAPKQELPATSDDPTAEQRWTRKNRVEIVRWADWRAEDALDEGWMDGDVAVRDRALVALLGYSGVRGAEILADSRDDDRNGIRWHDIDLEDGTMRVLGKRKNIEHVAIHEKPLRYLRLHKRRQDPTSDAWPVFATRHAYSLRTALPDHADSDGDLFEACREYEATPPALTTNGGRSIVERLSLESGIRGSDGDVLKPHAARRGLGKELYQQAPEKAQQQLRHQDIATTNKHYNDVEAVEQKADIDEMID